MVGHFLDEGVGALGDRNALAVAASTSTESTPTLPSDMTFTS